MRGKNIFPFPVREADSVHIYYRLYCCLKHILDGCYPKYFLENYLEKNRSNMYWRAVSYYLSQSMSTISPSIEFMPIDSLQKINIRNTSKLKFYEKFRLGVEPNLTMEESEKWFNALSESEKSVA